MRVKSVQLRRTGQYKKCVQYDFNVLSITVSRYLSSLILCVKVCMYDVIKLYMSDVSDIYTDYLQAGLVLNSHWIL